MLFFECSYKFVRCVKYIAKLQKATISFVMSVRRSVHKEEFGSHLTYFVKSGISVFLEKLSR
jgi:hypothetical protein